MIAVHLKTLKLTGWRNYTGENVNFSPGINLFLGKNGQGKTNLLEAVFFLACGQSPRTSTIEEIINWNSKYFFVRGEFCNSHQLRLIEMGGARDGRRVSKVDGVVIGRLAEISQIVNAVFFMPEDLYLIKGGPEKRRRFLDMEISQLSSNYRYNLANYKKFLRQRNALLKSNNQDRILLDVLTGKLAELAGPIAVMRSNYIKKLSVLARLNHRKLSSNREELSLHYNYSIKPDSSYQQVLDLFQGQKQHELRYRATAVGPHKDDIIFSVNGTDLRTYGSQGQQRTAVLALKLAEIELFKAETNRYPLLLLDDVFSELDEGRKSMLLEYLSGRVQTFISSAEPFSQGDAKTYWIDSGSIKERD